VGTRRARYAHGQDNKWKANEEARRAIKPRAGMMREVKERKCGIAFVLVGGDVVEWSRGVGMMPVVETRTGRSNREFNCG